MSGIKKGVKNLKVRDEEEEEEEEEEQAAGEEEEEEDDEEAQLPAHMQKIVDALEGLHAKIEDEVTSEYKKERIALELKYAALKKPYYEQRKALITGETPVEGAEIPEGTPKGLPAFWLRVLASHPYVAESLHEADLQAFKSLTDITTETSEDFTSFTLNFYFAENEFFTNSVLSKVYKVTPDLVNDEPEEIDSVTGTEIEWKAGKSLVSKEIKKKVKAKSGKNKGQTKTITKVEFTESFFHYFGEPKEEEEEAEEEEEGKAGGNPHQLSIEADYEIGAIIRSMVPDAIKWFTGENSADDYAEYDDEDGEDGEDGDEDDDEDDEDDDEPPRGAKGGKGGKGGSRPVGAGFGGPAAGGAPGAQPECKQN